MHVLRSLSMIGLLAIGAAAAAVPDDPHNVTPIDVNSAAPKFVAKEVDVEHSSSIPRRCDSQL